FLVHSVQILFFFAPLSLSLNFSPISHRNYKTIADRHLLDTHTHSSFHTSRGADIIHWQLKRERETFTSGKRKHRQLNWRWPPVVCPPTPTAELENNASLCDFFELFIC